MLFDTRSYFELLRNMSFSKKSYPRLSHLATSPIGWKFITVISMCCPGRASIVHGQGVNFPTLVMAAWMFAMKPSWLLITVFGGTLHVGSVIGLSTENTCYHEISLATNYLDIFKVCS